MSEKIIVILLIFINLIIFLKFEKISKLLKLYDHPDQKRKFHKKPISILGGLIIYFSILILFLLENFLFFQNSFFESYQGYIFILVLSIIFLIYLYDDLNSLGPNLKLFFLIIIILFHLKFDQNLIINSLEFSFFEKELLLGNFAIPFTIFCFIIFINAFNMFDGINLQSGFYLLLFFLIFLIKGIDSLFFISLLIPLILFLYYNYRNKIFLGNNGTYFLSFLISIYLIKSNIVLSTFLVEEILILLIIPGLDMLRLFVIRFIKGKSPFLPDKNHLHHLLLKKHNQFTVSLIIIMLTIIPYLIFILFLNNLNVLFLQFLFYFILIYQNKVKTI